MLAPMNSRGGWHGHFFVQGLGLTLVAKTRPHQPLANKKPRSGVPVGFFFFLIFFLNEVTAGTPRHVSVKRFTQTFKDLICLRSLLSRA